MGRGIALGVPVGKILRHAFIQLGDYVALHVRVGVLVDSQPAGGVRHKNVADPALHPAFAHQRPHLAGYVRHLRLGRSTDFEFVHHFPSARAGFPTELNHKYTRPRKAADLRLYFSN